MISPFLPRKVLLMAAVLAVFPGLHPPVRAEELPDFRPMLAKAVADHAETVTIPAGIYRLGPLKGSAIHVTVEHAKNLKIVADGVTMICTDLTRALEFKDCDHVMLTGLTVDYDPLPFTQGTIVRVSDDKNAIDIALHKGYPRVPYSRIDICDPKTRFRKSGMPYLWGTKAEMIDADTVRISLKKIGKIAAVGDLASLSGAERNGGAPHGIEISNCSGMVFENVTVNTAPGMGIIESDGEGGMRYTGCRVVPGPKPPGADEERLLSTTWDAVQSKTMKHGPVFENGEIDSAGDDSWSVQSSDYVVIAKNGADIFVAYRDQWSEGPQPGDRIVAPEAALQATVTKRTLVKLEETGASADTLAKLKEVKSWSFWRLDPKYAKLTLDHEVPFSEGQSVMCPDRQGNGFVFRNNRLHSPGRILIKAGDGIIEGNTIVHCHAGVTVCPEVPTGDAAKISNLLIRHNSFTGTGNYCPAPWSTQAGCISVSEQSGDKGFRPAGIFENVAIEDNVFKEINGPNIVVTSTQGVRIACNQFVAPFQTKPNETGAWRNIPGNALIWIATSTGVDIRDNTVSGQGKFLGELVGTGPDVKEITLKDGGVSPGQGNSLTGGQASQ